MTQLLYLEDFDVLTCDSVVTAITPTDNGRIDVQLAATCFYPRGDGQDSDKGTFLGANGAIFIVEEVQLDNHGIVHHIGTPQFGRLVIGYKVQGLVNQGRRKISTWLHSAGHVVDMAVNRLGLSWAHIRGSHYPNMCFIEYKGEIGSNESETIRRRIEEKANLIITRGTKNEIRFMTADDIRATHRPVPANFPANKPSRVVMYGPDFGLPCDGTHVKDARILKQIDIAKIQAKKGLIRVFYRVGGEPPFIDRADAGRRLAEKLLSYQKNNLVVYALPRGGVPVGIEIAQRLGAPLELLITRKIGHPADPEQAIGAVDEDGKILWDFPAKLNLSQEWLDTAIVRARGEVTRRQKTYLNAHRRLSASGKTAIVVDDGAASGLTIMAAIKKLLTEQPKQIIIALPIAHQQAISLLQPVATKIICLYAKRAKDFAYVGSNYQYFPDVTDTEVLQSMG